jgi:hypothetical protein
VLSLALVGGLAGYSVSVIRGGSPAGMAARGALSTGLMALTYLGTWIV